MVNNILTIAPQCSLNRKIKARETDMKDIRFVYFERFANSLASSAKKKV